MTTHAPGREPTDDDYLRAALRHAPDHDLTPPAGLSQTILAAARQLHRPVKPVAEAPAPRPPVPRQVPWSERLQWLLTPRWAGGAAAVLLSALVLGLWFDQDLPPAVDERHAAPVDGRPTLAADASPPVAPPAPATPAAKGAPPTAPATTPPAAGGQLADASKRTGGAATPAALSTAPAPARSEMRREQVAPAGGGPESRPAAAAKAPADRTDAAQRSIAEAAPAGSSRAAARDGAATVPAAPASAASPALTLWRRSSAEMQSRSAIWTWQPGTAPSPRSFDVDAQAWLLRLMQAARGRWVDVAETNDGGAATDVRWWRDDQPVARLRIESAGLRWIEPSGRIRYAPMDPAAIERLRAF